MVRDRGLTTFVLFLALIVGVLVVARGEGGALANAKSKFAELSLAKKAAFLTGLITLIGYAILGFMHKSSKVLLVDFHGYRVPDKFKTTRQQMIEKLRKGKGLPEEGIQFHELILEKGGIGDATGLPESIDSLCHPTTRKTHKTAMAEAQMVIFDVAEEVMRKTGISAQEIDIVMVSCSSFAPTPSLAAMVVNKFRMRSEVLTYSFSGMGCASGLVCVDLAKHLLKALPNSTVLIVNHENVTSSWYQGKDRSMMVTNCLFRLGGAAAILSNRLCDTGKAKYELVTSLRTHLGSQDDAFNCMEFAEDADGFHGILMQKHVVEVAGRALKTNIAALAPRVLPYTELAKAAVDKSYTPSFRDAFDHFLLHTGGRGILDDLESNLKLTAKQAQPSKETLWRFGNTSAASTWYTLGGIEHSKGVRKGDRVWQLGFGGGFKCVSAVWRARRNIKERHSCWE